MICSYSCKGCNYSASETNDIKHLGDNMKKSDFLKCHAYKLFVIAAMLFFEIANLVYMLNADYDKEYGWLYPYPAHCVFITDIVAEILMLLPPIVLSVHVIRHRKDPYCGYNDWSAPIIAVLKALGFIAGYIVLRYILILFLVLIPAMFVSAAS